MNVSLVFLLGLLAAVAVVFADVGEKEEKPALGFHNPIEALSKFFGHDAAEDGSSQDYDISGDSDPGFFWHHNHRRRHRCHRRRRRTTTTSTSTTEPSTTSTSTTEPTTTSTTSTTTTTTTTTPPP